MFEKQIKSKISIDSNKTEKIYYTTYKLFNLSYWKTREHCIIGGGKSERKFYVFNFLIQHTHSCIINDK